MPPTEKQEAIHSLDATLRPWVKHCDLIHSNNLRTCHSVYTCQSQLKFPIKDYSRQVRVHIQLKTTTIMQYKILTAVQRNFGEYWSSLDTRSTASGGNCLWNNWNCNKCKIGFSLQHRWYLEDDPISKPYATDGLWSEGTWTQCNLDSCT